MEPDDIPQRRDGESMAEYCERLEMVIIATMIDENGSIRPEYANSDDLEIRRHAIWAQAKHAKNRIQHASEAELEQIVSRSYDLAILKNVEGSLFDKGKDVSSTSMRTQTLFDSVADKSTDSAAFPVPSG